MNIQYDVIGDPFVTGVDHEITTLSAEFDVVTVDGGSGMNAHNIVIGLEQLLQPYEFRLSTLN